MSRILVIEPYRLLQYALAATVGAVHELSIVKTVPRTADGANSAIIDGASLRELDQLSRRDLESIRGWRIPVIWLDIEDGETPAMDQLKRFKLPLDRESLKQVLAVLQAVSETSTITHATAQGDRQVTKTRSKALETGDSNNSLNQNVVDLVDVVEEIVDEEMQMKSARKE